jgi:hypothetical protein
MAFVVEQDEALDPVNISLAGAGRVLLEANDIPHAVKQLPFGS